MKRIESFCVNHDKLTPGMYVSRIDGDAITYDVRMVVPNAGVYLENDGIHTFEHLFATYVRNTADFYLALENAGFERLVVSRKRYFKGLSLKSEDEDFLN